MVYRCTAGSLITIGIQRGHMMTPRSNDIRSHPRHGGSAQNYWHGAASSAAAACGALRRAHSPNTLVAQVSSVLLEAAAGFADCCRADTCTVGRQLRYAEGSNIREDSTY